MDIEIQDLKSLTNQHKHKDYLKLAIHTLKL